MTRHAREDRSNACARPRWRGGQGADARKHGTAYEFPSLWESMEEDVGDQFEDWR